MSNLIEFVDGDMTEEDRKKIDELLIKIDEENELTGKIGKLESENARLMEENENLRGALEVILDATKKEKVSIPALRFVAYTALKGY